MSTTVCTVFGATGQQGGGVARALSASGRFSSLRLVTRDTTSEKSRKVLEECQTVARLLHRHVDISLVAADLNDAESVSASLRGATHAFCVTDWWAMYFAGGANHEAAVRAAAAELQQGKKFVDAAKENALQFVVYSGLENIAKLRPDLPSVMHFNAKGEVEEYLFASGVPGASTRVSFYSDNLLGFIRPQNGVLALPLADKPMGVISIAELGFIVDGLFKEVAAPGGIEKYSGRAIGCAGELLTGQQLCETWSKYAGRPVTYMPLPWQEAAKFMGTEMAQMFEFYQDLHNCVRDPDESARLATGRLSTLDEFFAAAGDKAKV